MPADRVPPPLVPPHRLLLRLIMEMSRHAGHADIIRETLDGRTAFELVAMESRR